MTFLKEMSLAYIRLLNITYNKHNSKKETNTKLSYIQRIRNKININTKLITIIYTYPYYNKYTVSIYAYFFTSMPTTENLIIYYKHLLYNHSDFKYNFATATGRYLEISLPYL